MFTDNNTAEAAFYKNTSSSAKLFDLVLRLRMIQMNGSIIKHFVHVAGARMVAQGTDGLSRGQGVMKEGRVLDFIPLHFSALECQGQTLYNWIESLYGCLGHVDFLEPKDWYHRGHFKPRCVWTPPPAAADAMLEQLATTPHAFSFDSTAFDCTLEEDA